MHTASYMFVSDTMSQHHNNMSEKNMKIKTETEQETRTNKKSFIWHRFG